MSMVEWTESVSMQRASKSNGQRKAGTPSRRTAPTEGSSTQSRKANKVAHQRVQPIENKSNRQSRIRRNRIRDARLMRIRKRLNHARADKATAVLQMETEIINLPKSVRNSKDRMRPYRKALTQIRRNGQRRIDRLAKRLTRYTSKLRSL